MSQYDAAFAVKNAINDLYPFSFQMFQLADALNMTAYTVLKYVEEGKLQFGRGTFERMQD